MARREPDLRSPRIEQHLGRIEPGTVPVGDEAVHRAVGDGRHERVAVTDQRPAGELVAVAIELDERHLAGVGGPDAHGDHRGDVGAHGAATVPAAVDWPTMSAPSWTPPTTVDEVAAALTGNGYLPDEGLATAVFLATSLRRPLLLEGEAGVGKTELAKVLAAWSGGELIRLQCYEGIDAAQAVYDWDYGRQLLHLRAAEATGATAGRTTDALEAELYQERFLVKRALLRAIEPREGPPPVLLVDEVDRADDEFEAYLLEVLSDWQITVPELGTFHTDDPPIVVLTSNRTRDVHDALKRRCLYHWVEHPGFDREVAIVRLRVPEVGESLARQVAAAVAALRDLSLYKPPGVAETIDWATALGRLGVRQLDEQAVASTLGTVLKYREDHERVDQHGLDDIVKRAVARWGE